LRLVDIITYYDKLKPKKNFSELNTDETNLTKNVSYIKFSSQYTNKYCNTQYIRKKSRKEPILLKYLKI